MEDYQQFLDELTATDDLLSFVPLLCKQCIKGLKSIKPDSGSNYLRSWIILSGLYTVHRATRYRGALDLFPASGASFMSLGNGPLD